MLLPNKVVSYQESVISIFSLILRELCVCDVSPSELFYKIRSNEIDITRYIDALDSLFALGKIIYSEESGCIHYVD